MTTIKQLLLIYIFFFFPSSLASIISGEDGYRLWLKYDRLNQQSITFTNYVPFAQSWYVGGHSATSKAISDELEYAFNGLFGKSHRVVQQNAKLVIVYGADATTLYPQHARQLSRLNDEGYLIKIVGQGQKQKVLVLANTDIGALYGSYALLRKIQTGTNKAALNLESQPQTDIRVLNHWDNPNRHVERGYSGQSIWNWHKLPTYIDQRYIDYARANASIGINGTVLNNVNANAIMLRPDYLKKVKALADTFRPYGVKVYLSVKFSSPQLLGGLDTSDPVKTKVQQWWKDKVAEIYQEIPDFGGFLVKANSEGQPGPGDYGRTHAEGANMLADALKPYGGIVMWRAFVYANEKNEERSKQAYSEFKPLDGQFRDNVLVQVKNGPIDFQPREPYSPLFGATPNTPMMMEFQITMEYLGFSTHFVYLGPMYEEVLKTDTYAKGQGSTVGKVVSGGVFPYKYTGMAGVSNIGMDRNWTGHIILQSNWFVFGRMAWQPDVSAEEVAQDWVKMTLSNNQKVVDSVTKLMMSSHETTVNYMTPLGLHHIMGTGHHYGPAPWVDNLGRADWTPVYYHRATKDGIGFNRSPSGVNSVAQYLSPYRELLSNPDTTPEKFLLWFHHLPWDYKIKSSGRSLWDELAHRYYLGVEQVANIGEQWNALEGLIAESQFRQVQMSNLIHLQEAKWWRDACMLYFQSLSGKPIPDDLAKPQHDLKYYQSLTFPYAPGQGH